MVKKASALTANGDPHSSGRSLFRGLAFLSTVPIEGHIKPSMTLNYGWRWGLMVVQGAEFTERPTLPNGQLRVVGGVRGGHGVRLAERLTKLSNKGGWWGLMVVGQSEASAERPDQIAGQARNDTGWWSGVTEARPAGWKNRIGGKAPAAYLPTTLHQNRRNRTLRLRQ